MVVQDADLAVGGSSIMDVTIDSPNPEPDRFVEK
jgi:hypothetical protein